MKLNILSNNLIIAINEMVKDQTLAKLISVYTNTPLESEDVDGNALVMNNIFPSAYNVEIPEEQKVEVRVFFPSGDFDKSNNIARSEIYFQIILHRDLQRIKINGEKRLREFEIINKIIELFNHNSISTLGRIHFHGYQYGHIDKDYYMYTIAGEIMTL